MLEKLLHHVERRLRPAAEPPEAALVLSGGGARAAFQAGVLRYIADEFPEAHFPILTGVSAGAINAAHLANHPGPFGAATEGLADIWRQVTTEQVYEPESGLRLLWSFLRGGGENGNGTDHEGMPRALVDTAPLRAFLERQFGTPSGVLGGVEANFRQGRLKAFGIVTTNYSTAQSVTFVQGDEVELWERPDRVSVHTTLTLDHVMASTALPLIFPAVQIGDAWDGGGGIALSAPLATATHLGADRLLVISTRYSRSRAEADEPAVRGYPPVAQIAGILLNAVFLDVLDQDARTMHRINDLVRKLPPRKRNGLRPIRLLEIRPSVDIGRLSGEYEATLPGAFRFLSRGLGTGETRSPDWLSMLLFEDAYVACLIEIGYADARRSHDALAAFLEA